MSAEQEDDDWIENPHELADQLLEEIREVIEDGLTLVEQGEHVHLEGLDKKVSDMCKAILLLSQDDAKKYSEMLQSLMEALKHLGEGLEENRAEVARQIRGLGMQHKAAAAYKASDMIAPAAPQVITPKKKD